MLKELIAPLFVSTIMLLALVPSKALAQAKAAESDPTLSSVQVKPRLDLKAAFAKEIAEAKARTLTAADYRRIEKERQDQQSQQASKQGLTKREKIGLIVGGLVIVAVTVVLLIEGIADDPPFCFEAPDDPYCR